MSDMMRCGFESGHAAAMITAIWCAAFLTGCNSSGCLDNRNSLPLAGFYDASTGDAVSVSGLSIGGVGAPGDSLLADAGENIHSIYLPFRSTQDETTFVFSTKAKTNLAEEPDDMVLSDYVTFRYESIPYFASADCGAMYRYRILAVDHTSLFIDSVGIIDSLITNTDMERIKIYLRHDPTTDEE